MLTLGPGGVAALALVGALAVGLLLWQARALQAQQRRQREWLQAENERLEREVAQRTARLTDLARHLQDAREEERSRLARDLHDELGAFLTSAKLDAARIRSRLAGTAPEALERLTHLVATLDSVIGIKRRITEDLRPSALGHLGLVATLEILADEFGERSGLAVHCALDPVALSPAAELVVYRVVQEAVNNLAKHARAREVWLGLTQRDGRVEVSVRDDGVGFDLQRRPGRSFGLEGMRFRVEAEGGALAMSSGPGGTRVVATLPTATAVPGA